MLVFFLLLMSPVVTFLVVVLRENNNSMREYKEMKNKVDGKKDKIKRLFTN
jgi:hypothetical protein